MGAERAEKSASGFIPALESSRGIAALMVALFHSAQSEYFNGAGQRTQLLNAPSDGSFSFGHLALRIAANGHGAVTFFFVLSGFVLTMMLHRGPQDLVASLNRFVVGRIFRIYPAIISTLVIFTLVFAITGHATASPDSFTAWNLFLNGLLVHADINGVMWSLQVEMISLPLIFLSYTASRRWGVFVLYIVMGALLVLSFSKSFRLLLGPPIDLSKLFVFLVGMIAFEQGRSLVSRVPPVAVLMIGCAGFELSRPLLGWASHWSVLFESLFASWIIISFAFGHRDGRWLIGPLRWIGRVSYSFYLLHALTLVVLWNIPTQLGAAVAAGWSPFHLAVGLFLASSAAILPVAWLQYHFVERVGMSFGRRMVQLTERARDGRSIAALSTREL